MNLPIPFALDPIAPTIATITTRRIKESITTLIEMPIRSLVDFISTFAKNYACL